MQKGTILVAEDDDAMRRFIEVTLERENLTVLSVRDGLEALEIALDRSVDLIITDAIMPNLSGFDLSRILRQNPVTKDIPIIVLTGFDQVEEAKSIDREPDQFLRKGENLKVDLLKAVSDLLPTVELVRND